MCVSEGSVSLSFTMEQKKWRKNEIIRDCVFALPKPKYKSIGL